MADSDVAVLSMIQALAFMSHIGILSGILDILGGFIVLIIGILIIVLGGWCADSLLASDYSRCSSMVPLRKLASGGYCISDSSRNQHCRDIVP